METSTNIFGRLEVNSKPSDYAISSAIGAGILTGSLKYQDYKEGKITKQQAISHSVKVSAQTAMATGASIASVQYLANKNYLGAFFTLAVGVGSVIAVEKICKKTIKEEKNGN